MLRSIRNRLRGHVPFTNWWIVWRKLNKTATSMLDIGCGRGNPMVFINRDERFSVIGIDGFQPYVAECEATGKYHDVRLADIRQGVPFPDKSFDVVVALQVLEHLDREDGERLIGELERAARRQVVLSTDINEFVQGAIDGNELQTHRHIWEVSELRNRGFSVYGLGLRGFGGDTGCGRFIPQPLRWIIATCVQILVGPVVYHYPRLAGAVVCVKNIR